MPQRHVGKSYSEPTGQVTALEIWEKFSCDKTNRDLKALEYQALQNSEKTDV